MYITSNRLVQLKQFKQSVDLTERAREGKLDPTIGETKVRDYYSSVQKILIEQEIRRTIKVRFLASWC
jgi:ATP-dependent Clp protease ATP-binding subunit ClpA